MRVLKNYSYMMMKSVALVMLAAFSFASCKKDHDKQTPAAVEGTYTGKYGFGDDVPDTDYKLNFKAGGILEERGVNSGAVVGTGTWTVNGNAVTGKYTMNFSPFSKYAISATFNPTTKKLLGTWGLDDNPSNGGKIDMTRQ